MLLISHRVWQSRYGGTPSIIGLGVSLDGRPATIIGVLSPVADSLLPGADWWAALALAPARMSPPCC